MRIGIECPIIGAKIPDAHAQRFRSRTDGFVIQRFANPWHIFFVYDFIGLQVEGPLSGALRKGDVGEVAEELPPETLMVSPFILHHPDLFAADARDQIQGLIVRFSYQDNVFIYQGENREN